MNQAFTRRPMSLMIAGSALATVGAFLTTSLVAPAVAIAESGLSVAVAQDPTVELKRQTMARMLRKIDGIELVDQRLEDVITFIAEVSQADIEPLWADSDSPFGLDKEATINLKAPRRLTLLQLLELTLDKADAAAPAGATSTWQMTDYGTLEFGPRERLNRRQRLEVIDIHDMLLEIPDYDNPPNFDLNTIFNQAQQGGGGGGQSPFQINQQQPDALNPEEQAQELVDLIVASIEPDQWEDSGGTGGSIRYFRGTLLVRASDYMHRALSGYTWWPAIAQRARTTDGKRVVTLNARGLDLDAMAQLDPSTHSGRREKAEASIKTPAQGEP